MQYSHAFTPCVEITTGPDNKQYAVFNETWYSTETPEKVIEILDGALMRSMDRDRPRFKLHYGDPKTGKLWGDVEVGYIGRSGGVIKVPLIVKNSRSLGGGAILDNCILKIEHANKRNGGVIYNINNK